MATNNIQENLKKYFYSGVGLAAHTADVVQKSVNELVKKGKVSEADGRKIVSEAIKKVEAHRPEIEAKYNETVHKFVKLTASEVSKLQKKIEKLESQLSFRKHAAGHSASRPAAKKAAKKRPSRSKKSSNGAAHHASHTTSETTHTAS